MSVVDDLIAILKRLRLSGILQSLDVRTREAADDSLSHTEFLYRLLQDEVSRRDQKGLDLRLRRAAFDELKVIEDFDFTFNPRLPKAKLVDLSTGHFIQRHEAVILVGPTGVGKSHLAQALGHRACRLGHSVVFTNANEMFVALRAARAENGFERRLLRYTSADLLIVDDLGLRPLRGDEPLDLYEIIRQRHHRGATVMTSNRAIEEWPPLFGDALLASAAMNRLLDGAHVVVLEGASHRKPPQA